MRNILAIKGVFFLIFALAFAAEGGDKAAQVAVLPFEVRGQEGLAYLQDGIFDMLSSRLFAPSNIQVLPKEEALKAAGQRAEERNIDYIVTGTINKIGNAYAIDARLIDARQNQVLLTSSYSQKTLDDVIPWVERFSQEVRGKISPQDVLASVPAPVPGQPGRPFASGAGAPPMPKPEDLLNPDFIRQFRSETLSAKFWRSQEFPILIRGVDVGDVDGDGRNETVIIDESNLWVYRYRDGKLVEMFHKKAPSGAEYISLDVADFNGNGRAEIYVSVITTYKMESFVLEYDGKTFRPLAENLNHHVRAAYIGEGKLSLVGQNRSIREPFFGPIYRLEWRDGILKRGENLKLPVTPSISAFAQANIISGEKGNLVLVDANDKLRLFDDKGKMKWRSKEYYGGSQRSREEIDDRITPLEQIEVPVEIAYVPLRIVVCDLNRDNQMEILINRNTEAFGKVLDRLRIYTGGEIYNLVWDGLTLTTNWNTRKFDGYVADFQVKDIDNDGQDELVIALVLRTEWIDILRTRSAVIAYKLNVAAATADKKPIDIGGK
jgi:TolB-like protein